MRLAMCAWALTVLNTSASIALDAAAGAAAVPPDVVHPSEKRKTIEGVVEVAGKRIDYSGTFGTLTIADDSEKAVASMFYASYTVRKPDPRRPVTFIYNGGPGAPSAFLHLASIGPVRLDLSQLMTGAQDPELLRLVPNEESLLDTSDLVFLDAVGTGLSRSVGTASEKQFFGVDQDIDSFARAIKRWLTLNGRWTSPKFLMGESYGGTRSVGLASVLPKQGVYLDGIILLNGGLDRSLRDPYNDAFYVALLPTYAATAWYHQRLNGKSGDLDSLLTEVRKYAQGPYLHALQMGNTLTDDEKAEVARQLSRYTGLSPEVVLNSNLRVDFLRFRQELLRDKHLVLGQLDTRVTGVVNASAADDFDSDPAYALLSTPIESAINAYLFNTVGYDKELQYRMNRPQAQQDWVWTRSPNSEVYPWVTRPITADLSAAMRNNPKLKVLAMLSYFDLAVPFAVTEYDLAHLRIDAGLSKNVSVAYYEQGHVVYVQPSGLKKMKADLVRFYEQASPRAAFKGH